MAMEYLVERGATGSSLMFHINLAGTGLVYSDITVRYIRPGESALTTLTSINLTTIGTYQSPATGEVAIKAVDGTNLPGWYECHFHADQFNTTSTRRGIVMVFSFTILGTPYKVYVRFQLTGISLHEVRPDVGAIDAIDSGVITSSAFASGAITSSVFASGAINAAAIAADAIGASELAADAVSEIAAAIVVSAAESNIAHSGTASAGASSSLTLAGGASAVDNFYRGMELFIHTGTGAKQAPRTITAYNGTTKLATVDTAWTTTPDATSQYVVRPWRSPRMDTGARVELGSAGFDQVTVATGVNARQSLSIIVATTTGKCDGADDPVPGPIVFKDVGDGTTTRVTTEFDAAGNRTSVTLSVPA